MRFWKWFWLRFMPHPLKVFPVFLGGVGVSASIALLPHHAGRMVAEVVAIAALAMLLLSLLLLFLTWCVDGIRYLLLLPNETSAAAVAVIIVAWFLFAGAFFAGCSDAGVRRCGRVLVQKRRGSSGELGQYCLQPSDLVLACHISAAAASTTAMAPCDEAGTDALALLADGCICGNHMDSDSAAAFHPPVAYHASSGMAGCWPGCGGAADTVVSVHSQVVLGIWD